MLNTAMLNTLRPLRCLPATKVRSHKQHGNNTVGEKTISQVLTAETTLTVILPEEFVAERLSFVSSAERNFVDHKVKDDRELKTVLTRSLITQDTD